MAQTDFTVRDTKSLIVDALNLEGMTPDSFGDHDPLFGDGLGLDSVDALELVVALEKRFGIRIQSQEVEPETFASAARLHRYVLDRIDAVENTG